MSKKRACFNPNCSDYKKTKHKKSVIVCPHCQGMLEFVCAKKGCYKVLPEEYEEQYCPNCKEDIHDRNVAILDGAKKIGGVAGAILAGFSLFVGRDISKKK